MWCSICDMRQFWRLGIARIAVFLHSLVVPLRCRALKLWKVMARKCCFAGIISPSSYRTSYASAEFFVAGAIWLKHPCEIAKMYWNSDVKCVVDIAFFKEVSQKSFVLKLATWTWNQLTFKSITIQNDWNSNQLNLKEMDFQISNQLDFKSIESQISWIWNQLKFKSSEPESNWNANQLHFKSSWISNQLTFKSIDIQIQNIRIWKQLKLNFNSAKSQISWLSNQLNPKSIWHWNSNQLSFKSVTFKSVEFQICSISNQINFKSVESQINWISHFTPIGFLSLETSATASSGIYVLE